MFMFINLGNFFFFVLDDKFQRDLQCAEYFFFKNGMFCLFKKFPAHFMFML